MHVLPTLTRIQLVLCAIPVFIKFPGSASLDLGGRTEGRHTFVFRERDPGSKIIIIGFVTNRRLLLSSSGQELNPLFTRRLTRQASRRFWSSDVFI